MTQWDMEHDHPITQEEMFLDDIAAEEIEWIDNLKDAQFTSLMDTPILLDHPSILVIRHPELPANTDADTVQTFFPGQSVASPQAPGDDHHTPSIQQPLHANDGNRVTCPSPEAPNAGAPLGAAAMGLCFQ